jgi:hypothetical protein
MSPLVIILCVLVGDYYMKTYRELEVKLRMFLAMGNPLYITIVL